MKVRVIAEDNMEDCKTANQISLKIPQMLAVSLTVTVDCSFFVSAFSSLWFDQIITLQLICGCEKDQNHSPPTGCAVIKVFRENQALVGNCFQRETTKTGNI